ncbi:Glutathione transport system permease protein GsiD [bioreactor metagenome]|jgi:peptide/nickel transport system permease protein|uniref:Oligopeptide transport system permease protein AppC n=2 Tax=root TaxID=1 RepID=A0A653A0Q3_9SPIR|nr:ABC transporter permease [Spirochaetia bacterium]MDD3820261.1 ABC transporter permease [Spirochaetales bacterium]NLX46155.1 ABC transporter permease [Treponema sp.]VBB41231.1 Oligopeptide transport system permease protein AppC [uncultured Spirochaetota bacterium]HAP55439.1 peptide ABC transporter permease [Spirochaetaceae bacterium]
MPRSGVLKKTNPKSSYFADAREKFKEHRLAVFGLAVLTALVVIVVFAPMLFPLDPYTSDYFEFGTAPSAKHPLGTDAVGRDLLARLIYGGRTSLFVGLTSTLISLLIGVPLGLTAGYYRGWWETLVMRLADIFMSFPAMVLILVLVAVVGPSIWSVTVVIGILGWTQFARLVFANVLSVREKEYVESAYAIGTKDFTVLTKYILPNSIAPILISMTFRTAQAILMESSLSFLGMGVQPPMASWGNLMNEALSITVLSQKPWIWAPPGIALVLIVLSINFVGDGVRDALDPKMRI